MHRPKSPAHHQAHHPWRTQRRDLPARPVDRRSEVGLPRQAELHRQCRQRDRAAESLSGQALGVEGVRGVGDLEREEMNDNEREVISLVLFEVKH
jgi:hypothetical protein